MLLVLRPNGVCARDHTSHIKTKKAHTSEAVVYRMSWVTVSGAHHRIGTAVPLLPTL